jgi:hypothetical protein
MKTLLLFLVLLVYPFSLQADSLIQNGDFSSGDADWQGDGKTSAATKGLSVTLSANSWTRIYQTFPSDKGTRFSIVVTYRLSPKIALSKDPADYTEISKRLQIPDFDQYGSIAVQPGEFYGTVGDPTSTSIAMEVFSPNLGTTDVQTYQHSYPPIPPGGNKTFALAFPPGSGTVVILSVAVTSN